jgi:hypothetical protein
VKRILKLKDVGFGDDTDVERHLKSKKVEVVKQIGDEQKLKDEKKMKLKQNSQVEEVKQFKSNRS